MKSNTLILGICLSVLIGSLFAFTNQPQEKNTGEFTSFTVVESIVPNGIGRSRIISAMEQRDYKKYTTYSVSEDGKKKKNKSDRGEIRVKEYEETKLLNFYNIGGIRFQNIAANDAIINSKVNTMLNEGWELINIVSGVESVGSEDDLNGIYITRFYFKK